MPQTFGQFAQKGLQGLAALPRNVTRGFSTSPQAGQGFAAGALKTIAGMNVPGVSQAAGIASTLYNKPAPRISAAQIKANKGYRPLPDTYLKTPSLSGTPTSNPTATQQYTSSAGPIYSGSSSLTPEQQKEADARQYLQDENDASLKYGSKNLVDMMRGNTGGDKAEDTKDFSISGDEKNPMTDTTDKTKTGYTYNSSSIIDQLRKRIGSLSAPSAEEAALNDQLAQFRGDASQGIAGLEGQGRGIPLTLVRGQQAKLGEQAALQEQTLLDRITAASAQRQAQLQATQNEYSIASDEQKRQEKLTAPTTVGNSILQFDPTTGTYKTLYTAPEETKAVDQPTSVQEYQFAQQNGYTGGFTDFLQAKAAASQNPANLQYVAPSANSSGGIFDPNAGTFTANPAQTKPVSDLTKQAASLINELVNAPGLEGATGTVRIAIPGTAAADFKAKLEQLKALLSLENITYLKGTGAISDREGALLSNAAASLDPKMSEGAFRNELVRLQTKLNAEVNGAGDIASDPRYQQLKNSGFSDDEINEYLGKANGASGSAQKIAAAIKQVESGGNYNARGGSGESGAYQFMPSTWKSWAGTYLGNANAPMTPENQDKVAQAKIQDLLNQGYTAEQVALTWNAGSPKRVKGVNRYGVAYDSGAYADKVLAQLG